MTTVDKCENSFHDMVVSESDSDFCASRSTVCTRRYRIGHGTAANETHKELSHSRLSGEGNFGMLFVPYFSGRYNGENEL